MTTNTTLIQHILSFFATHANSITEKENLHDIKEYVGGDELSAINRKKTAKYKKLLTNHYEPDEIFTGKIILVMTKNMEKGNTTSVLQKFEILVRDLEKDPGKNIDNSIVYTEPTKTEYRGEKQVIISDFFRDKKNIEHFLQACHKGLVRGIIPKMLTISGTYIHPLQKKYPHFFWTME